MLTHIRVGHMAEKSGARLSNYEGSICLECSKMLKNMGVKDIVEDKCKFESTYLQ